MAAALVRSRWQDTSLHAPAAAMLQGAPTHHAHKHQCLGAGVPGPGGGVADPCSTGNRVQESACVCVEGGGLEWWGLGGGEGQVGQPAALGSRISQHGHTVHPCTHAWLGSLATPGRLAQHAPRAKISWPEPLRFSLWMEQYGSRHTSTLRQGATYKVRLAAADLVAYPVDTHAAAMECGRRMPVVQPSSLSFPLSRLRPCAPHPRPGRPTYLKGAATVTYSLPSGPRPRKRLAWLACSGSTERPAICRDCSSPALQPARAAASTPFQRVMRRTSETYRERVEPS